MRHNCGRSEDLFSKLRRKSDPGSGLAVSIYQSAIFSALVLMKGSRAALPASRESPGGNVISGRPLVHAKPIMNYRLASRVEHGEEILIRLKPYRLPLMTAERKNAIQHAIDVMANGPVLGWHPKKVQTRRDAWVVISFDTFLFTQLVRYPT
jgi:hypothetical protein